MQARRRETDHALVVGDADEQGTVGIAVAQDGIDLERGPAWIGDVVAVAVVHDAFEDGERDDPHGTILAVDDPGLVAQLTATGAEIVERAVAALPAWVTRSVEGIVGAWARLSPAQEHELAATLPAMSVGVRDRVVSELEGLFDRDPSAQATTPLAILRSAAREPTELLRAFGIPGVVRDPFDERYFPDDIYDLAPKAPGDIGDPDLGPVFLAWGLTKAKVLRGRADPAE